jgi:hypothetical protein
MITLINDDEKTKAVVKALPDGGFTIDMIAAHETADGWQDSPLWTYRVLTLEDAMSRVVSFISGQKSVVMREPVSITRK